AWPLAARAQQPALPLIGYLSSGSQRVSGERLRMFLRGLNEAGYSEGKNIAIEYRWAEEQYDRPPDLAADLLHPSGIEGLIFGSWATLSGERLSCVGPAEGPGHGGVEISDELLDPGLQHLLAGEVAAADKLSYQNGKPDFDLIEP